MTLIKEIVKKPSEALQAMVDGLIRQSERPDFKIDMWSYGGYQSLGTKTRVCFGCAATCTIQEIAGKNLDWYNIRHEEDRAAFLGFDEIDLCQFEDAIDKARMGTPHILFEYYDIDFQGIDYSDYSDYCLNTDDWEAQLPKVQEFISFLKERGL